jgi:hypothetical protein
MKRFLCILAASAALGWAQPQPQKGLYTNIELTIYAVNGLAKELPNAPAEELPDDLSGTFKQLRSVLMYKSYKLVDTFTLRGRNNGGAQIGGEYPGFNYGQYDFKYFNAHVGTETPRMVHINGLRLEITRRPPGPIGQGVAPPIIVALVSTDIDLREGQKTVVGKSAVNGGADALILVIVPKVIE